MRDRGDEYAQRQLNNLVKRIVKEYNTAYRGIKRKADEYFEEFEKEDKKMFYRMDSGKITREEYLRWRKVALAQGKKWNDTIKAIARDYANITKIVADMTGDEMEYVYANNFNYGTYTIEAAGGINTNFTLYNKDAVHELLTENPDLLPKPNPNTVITKAERWNMKKVNSVLLQGIMQGDSINRLSKRLRQVTNMNINSSVRNARTMTGRAQNAGRYHAYERAESLGIDVKKVWVASLDNRTRHTHRLLDGEVVNLDEEFSNALMYPCDPDGAPEEVYNCRCTMIALPFGFSKDDFLDERISNVNYSEWKRQRK